MFPSTMVPKWPILVSQCWMDHQKPTILLIFDTLSLGGCGGHPMSPKSNLKVKIQMSRPNECTHNIKSNSTCTFLSVRNKLKKTFCPRTLCKWAWPDFLKLPCAYIHALQSRTGKYRVLQGNPCNENRIPAMRTGFPVMKIGFSLWELTYREFPVSLTGFGFAVYIELNEYGCGNFVCWNICLFTLTFYKVDFLGLANWSNLWESVVLDTFWTLDSV